MSDTNAYEIVKYVVVENAGQDNEIVVKRGTYAECERYIDFKYNDAEYDTLGVDIMGELEDGSLTTEI